MKAEERIAHLESELAKEQAKSARLEAEEQSENATLHADNGQLPEQMEQMLTARGGRAFGER